jgi:hypothetical protein
VILSTCFTVFLILITEFAFFHKKVRWYQPLDLHFSFFWAENMLIKLGDHSSYI